MKYRLTPYTIFEQGGRDYQEDYMCPKHKEASKSDRVFVLCDGMGGHSAGEVASRIVCETMSESVKRNCPNPEGTFTDEIFRRALSDAYDVLDKADDGAVKKMGTTMTFLKFHSEGCTVAHMGDSRVYHIRPGKDKEDTEILFVTSDHSLVNDLVRIGELTPEEARTSRQKNVITRAIQPNTERRSSADIHHITDIRPGDYFFMCTDGILENMEDSHIRNIFSHQCTHAQTKVDIITQVTSNNRDNHSAFIIRIDEVDMQPDSLPVTKPQVPAAPSQTPRKPVAVKKALPAIKTKTGFFSKGKVFWITIVLLLFVGAISAYLIPKYILKGEKKADVVTQQENVDQEASVKPWIFSLSPRRERRSEGESKLSGTPHEEDRNGSENSEKPGPSEQGVNNQDSNGPVDNADIPESNETAKEKTWFDKILGKK